MNKNITFILIGLSALLSLSAVSNMIKPTPDSSEYIGLAYSLTQGDGFTFNGNMGSYHPPATSLFLATVILISQTLGLSSYTIALMKLAQLALAGLFVLGSYQLARQYLSEKSAAITALLVLVNISLIQHCMFILSDMLYATLGIWTLVLLQSDNQSHKKYALAIILAAAAWATRMIGLTLFVAIIAWLLFGKNSITKKSHRFAWAILAAIIMLIPMILWKLFWQSSGDEYMNWFVEHTEQTSLIMIFWETLKTVAPTVPLRITQVLFNIEQSNLPHYFSQTIVLLLVISWAICLKKRRSISEFYTFFYLAIVVVSADQGNRYVLPILPLIFIYAIYILTLVANKLISQSITSRRIHMAIFSLLLILALPLMQHIIHQQAFPSPMTILRHGYIYPIIAIILAILIVPTVTQNKPQSLKRFFQTATLSFLILNIGIGWLYTATYSALEHRIISSRPPLLAGYVPYYQVGTSLKQLNPDDQPILCSQPSIINIACGLITREPKPDIEQLKQQFQSGKLKTVLLLENTDKLGIIYDPANEKLSDLIKQYQHSFKKVTTPASSDWSVYAYQEVSLAQND